MNIDYRDYEAIAALMYGTLEDWAFESAEHFTTLDSELNMIVAGVVTSNAIINMKNQ